MRLLFFFFLCVFVSTDILSAESRFGDLTEMRDDRMRGKDNQWVRPHPGPFVWNNIEKEKGIFSWDKADEYVTYSQCLVLFSICDCDSLMQQYATQC